MTYINDILATLTEAKDALEKLPELREEIRREREDNIRAESELHTALDANLKLQATIDELNAKVRSLEVERDDASFRELETADRLNAAKARLQAIIGSATDVLSQVEPPKAPEPTKAEGPISGSDTVVNQEPNSGLGVANSPEFIGEVKTDTLAPPAPPVETHIPAYVPQPYRGFRVWDRPDGVSWEEFVNGGGEAPSWYVSRSA